MDGKPPHFSEEKTGTEKDTRASKLEDLLEGYDRLRIHYESLAEISERISGAIRSRLSADELTTLLKKKMAEVGAVEETSKCLVHIQKEIEGIYELTPSEKERVLSAREELRKTMDYALKKDEENRSILSKKGVKIKRPF